MLRSRNYRIVVSLSIAILVTLFQCRSAVAQNEQFKFEITPVAGYRMGGSFDEKDGIGKLELHDSDAQGILINLRANPNAQYEILYGRQNTKVDTQGFIVNDPTVDLDTEYFHLGGTYLFDGENTRPFIALTVGVSHFDPHAVDLKSENFFSASFGGGVQLNASKRIGVRLEARVFMTLVNDDSSFFCSSIDGAGECLIQVDATAFTQWEARAGLVIRF